MTLLSTGFHRALELTECEPLTGDRAFTAVPQPVPWPKAYGGDMVAQSAAAANETVESDRTLHSVHSSFLRGVEVGLPIRYEVEQLRDGRGFSTRHVRGYQHEKLAFLCTASYTTGGELPTLQPAMLDVPGPETLPSSAEVLADFTGPLGPDGAVGSYWSSGRSFDMRHVPGPVYVTVEGERSPHQAVWVKAFENIGDDPATHRLAIAYVCDYTILEPILRALGLPWASEGLVTASLDHAMWFHGDARADEWLLYAQECVAAGDGRGLGIGRFFTRDGRLVATVAQEGMIRPGTSN